MCKVKNELIEMLKAENYCPVAIPRSNIEPLQIIEYVKHANGYEYVCNVHELFQGHSNYKLPKISKDVPAPQKLSKSLKTNVKLKIGIEYLDNVLSAFAGNNAKLGTKYNSAEFLQYTFNHLRLNNIDMAAFSTFINSAIPDKSKPDLVDKLKKGKLFVITTILKSKNFTLKTFDKNQKDATINIGNEQIGDLEIKAIKEQDSAFSILHTGKHFLTFAFKAVQIKYDEDGSFFYTAHPKRKVLLDAGEDTYGYLKPEDNFIEMIEEKNGNKINV